MTKLKKTVLLIAGVLLVNLGLRTIYELQGPIHRSGEIVSKNEIDPSWLFYTQSKQALAAEKEIRQKINAEKRESSK